MANGYGLYDMAGNVREWVVNPVGGRRYILGGAWNDYMFAYPYAVSPEDRSAQNGFRCAAYPAESAEILGAEPLEILSSPPPWRFLATRIASPS